MKKYKFLIIAVTTALLASCSLEEYNPHGMSTAYEWTTPEGFEKLVNSCYWDMVRITYGQAEDTYIMTSECGTDLWQDVNETGSNGNWSKIMRYINLDSSNGMLNEGFSSFYATLNTCNAAIEYRDQVINGNEALLNQQVAEAHFIRAHVLLNIVETWGGKYLPTTYTKTPISKLPCSKVNEFYQVIMSDLEYAMANLPIKQELHGRVTRAAAYHLYAKACLTYSTYTDGLGNANAISKEESDQLLEKAETTIKYLINNQKDLNVELYSDVNNVFNEDNNKNNKEALFIITHSTIQALNPRGNYFNRVWKHMGAYANNNAGIYLEGLQPSLETEVNGYPVKKLPKYNCYAAPSKYLLDLYVEKDMRYKAFFNDVFYVNKANNANNNGYTWTEGDCKRYGLNISRVGNTAFDITLGDTAVYLPRKAWSQAQKENCRYAVYNVDDNYKDNNLPKRFFPSLKKVDCPSLIYVCTNANKPYSSADCIIYRLGESYLLAAEICYRQNKNAEATTYINILRNRACEGHDGSLDVTASDINDTFLLEENAREMCGEWMRWMTLKRFRAFEKQLAHNPQATGFDKNIHYLRPIPDAEMKLIDNKDYQNPGY